MPELRQKPLAAAYGLALDVVFPRRCAGCRAWCDELFCASCRHTLRFVAPPFCTRCGLPLRDASAVHADAQSRSQPPALAMSGAKNSSANNPRMGSDDAPTLCASCRSLRCDQEISFDVARSPFEFEGALRTAVHRFKYEGKTALAAPLAALLEKFLRDEQERDEPCGDDEQRDGARMSTHVAAWMRGADLIVPVPLHSWRRFRRGYNQSELLARELGRCLNIPICNALRRARHTAPQVGLSARERADNVREAFVLRLDRAGAPILNPAHANTILLLDDVSTTGATLHECARVLKQAGIARVCALTLARVS